MEETSKILMLTLIVKFCHSFPVSLPRYGEAKFQNLSPLKVVLSVCLSNNLLNFSSRIYFIISVFNMATH